MKSAITIKTKVEEIVEAKMANRALDVETAMWVRDLPAKLRDKLESRRLIKRRASSDEPTARQFFKAAVRKRWIPSNPFGDLEGVTVRPNRERDYFITREETEALIDAAPDSQWRVIIALSRYGGLRCPSEHLSLKWDDILWDQGKIIVTSPKTAHHEGKGERVIPLFPELREHLDAAWDALRDEPGEYVITRYRGAKQNLRTTFLKIIKRAGLKPWPKLFHNLRASRQTELAAEFPVHVVCEWIGNSEAVAKEHYLRVQESDFARACTATRKTTRAGADGTGTERNGSEQEK